MELSYVRQLYDYNRWADRRILTVAGTLASDDFIRPMSTRSPFQLLSVWLSLPRHKRNLSLRRL